MKVKALILFCLLFCLSANVSPDNDPWKQKVAAELLLQAQKGGGHEFVVLLKKQADINPARKLPAKEEKGIFIFQLLKQTAEATQKRIRAILEKEASSFQCFYLANAVFARGNYALIKKLAILPEVAHIYPNPHIRLQEPLPVSGATPRGGAIEWGVERIGAPEVWEMGITGQGAVVAGEDTGYDWTHPTLKEKYRGWNGTSADHNYNWHDAIHQIDSMHQDSVILPTNNPCGLNSLFPCDDHNHGTHTMGTMVGDDGAGNQIGVAPGAKWIACRNMERGYGTPVTYIECFEWFLAPTDLNNENPDPLKAPHVINNSWRCPEAEGCHPGNFALMEIVVNNLKAAGIVVVASSGNNGSSCETINAPPAIFENSLTVGSTAGNDTISAFSSRGPVTIDSSGRIKPNVVAPGSGIRSSTRDSSFAVWSGTSMAAPHVAGTVALIISANPALAGQVDAIEDILEQSAVPRLSDQECAGIPGDLHPNHVYGFGRIHAPTAVNLALEYTTSTEEHVSTPQIEVFPNPFREICWFEWKTPGKKAQLEIYSPTGQLLVRDEWFSTQAPHSCNLGHFPSGIYFYRIKSGEGEAKGKLVKL